MKRKLFFDDKDITKRQDTIVLRSVPLTNEDREMFAEMERSDLALLFQNIPGTPLKFKRKPWWKIWFCL